MNEHKYSPDVVLPHGSYLINLGNPEKYVPFPISQFTASLVIIREKREKSYDCFIDDLKRCEQLGLKLYNFQCVVLPIGIPYSGAHIVSPGSTVGGATKKESISFIAQNINRAHRETEFVITVIENMVGSITALLPHHLNNYPLGRRRKHNWWRSRRFEGYN